nr:hypothetical protein [uncultured Sphaerochaeta sp.]
MKKTNFQVYIEKLAGESGKTLDQQSCDLLECSACIHRGSEYWPFGCRHGLFNDMFSTALDGAMPLGGNDSREA